MIMKKLPLTYKVVKHQTGNTTKKMDKEIKALSPGYRISKNNNKYYEARANRSDLNRKKKL